MSPLIEFPTGKPLRIIVAVVGFLILGAVELFLIAIRFVQSTPWAQEVFYPMEIWAAVIFIGLTLIFFKAGDRVSWWSLGIASVVLAFIPYERFSILGELFSSGMILGYVIGQFISGVMHALPLVGLRSLVLWVKDKRQ